MNHRNPRRRAAAPASLAGFALALAATAPVLSQTASDQYYDPPKLLKQGTSTTPQTGEGTVEIQVLVNADGTFKVQKIVKSTNHGDDQAALEIANSARYAPATKGGKKVAAFYTYTLKFVGAQASSADAASGGELAQYNAQVRAGNYAGAKAGLTQYLQAHPNDSQADALLGVANTFLNDFPAAAAAFDKASDVPQQYKAVEARAYAGAAEKAIAAKDGAAALAAARKANDLAPGVATLNLLGTAQEVSGDYAAAVTSFERARAQGADDAKLDNKQKAIINANLVSAYVGAGQLDKATALLPLVRQLDPSNASAEAEIVNYYSNQAIAAQNAGNAADAAALYEKAAGIGPAYAAQMYAREAAAYARAAKPDWKAVKAAADKALAVDQNQPEANYLAGVALANQGSVKDAVPYLEKAASSAKAAGDQAAAAMAEQALTKLKGAH